MGVTGEPCFFLNLRFVNLSFPQRCENFGFLLAFGFYVKSFWQWWFWLFVRRIFTFERLKFIHFSVTQILREINFCKFGVSNLLFWQFQHLWILVFVNFCILSELEFNKNPNSQCLQLSRTAVMCKLDSLKLISHRIWTFRKILQFSHPTVCLLWWMVLNLCKP